MEFKKTIISLLLLLTYSFGFAHNLVPHCGIFTIEKTPIYHEHSAKDEHNTTHHHITHNSHFDEGIFDYLMCLVDEAEAPERECSIEHCFTFNSTNFSLKDINKIQTVIVFFAIFQPIIQNEPISYFSTDIVINYSSPFVENSPHRGPPIFSC